MTVDAIATLLAGSAAVVGETYARLLADLDGIGPYRVEPKKVSIHLAREAGFAGVHPRKMFLYLNLHTDRPIESDRVAK